MHNSIVGFQHNMEIEFYLKEVCRNWISVFKNGCTNVPDEKRPGSPSISTKQENTEETCSIILDNRPVTIGEVQYHLRISHYSTHGIIQGRLVFSEVCATLFPKQLTGDHKSKSLTILKCLFKSCFKEGDAFLRLAITGNDT
jgi:hypothetical protein